MGLGLIAECGPSDCGLVVIEDPKISLLRYYWGDEISPTAVIKGLLELPPLPIGI